MAHAQHVFVSETLRVSSLAPSDLQQIALEKNLRTHASFTTHVAIHYDKPQTRSNLWALQNTSNRVALNYSWSMQMRSRSTLGQGQNIVSIEPVSISFFAVPSVVFCAYISLSVHQMRYNKNETTNPERKYRHSQETCKGQYRHSHEMCKGQLFQAT